MFDLSFFKVTSPRSFQDMCNFTGNKHQKNVIRKKKIKPKCDCLAVRLACWMWIHLCVTIPGNVCKQHGARLITTAVEWKVNKGAKVKCSHFVWACLCWAVHECLQREVCGVLWVDEILTLMGQSQSRNLLLMMSHERYVTNSWQSLAVAMHLACWH